MKIKLIKVIFIFLIFLYSNIVYGIEVPETDNQPIRLNDNEIFFPGGWKYENKNTKKIIPARIYNIKEKKFIDLNTEMKTPRNDYLVTKVEDKVLVIGGFDIDNKRVFDKAEIYDIKQNKFYEINNSNFLYSSLTGNILTLKNNKALLISHCEAELFDPQDNSFSIVKNIYSSDKSKKCSTNYSYKNIQIRLLKNGKVFIYGDPNQSEIFDPDKNIFEIVTVPDFMRLYNESVVLNNGKIIFIGWEDYDKGKVFEFNPHNNEFKYIANIKPGSYGHDLVVLNDNIILMIMGTIRPESNELLMHISGKSFSTALYDINKRKIYNMKMYGLNSRPYTFRLNNNSVLLFQKNKKPKVYTL